MDVRSIALIILGFVIFGVGAVTRMYMNFKIKRFMPSRSILASTEIGYWRLMRERKVPLWPFLTTCLCLPMGIVGVFAGVLMSGVQSR